MKFINSKTIKLITLGATLLNLGFLGYVVIEDRASLALFALAAIFQFLAFLFYFLANTYFIWTNHQLNVIQDIHGQHFSGLHRKVSSLGTQLNDLGQMMAALSATVNDYREHTLQGITANLAKIGNAVSENSARFGQLRGRLLEEYQILRKDLSQLEAYYKDIDERLASYHQNLEHGLEELNRNSTGALDGFSTAFNTFLSGIDQRHKTYESHVAALSEKIEQENVATTSKLLSELNKTTAELQQAVAAQVENASAAQREKMNVVHEALAHLVQESKDSIRAAIDAGQDSVRVAVENEHGALRAAIENGQGALQALVESGNHNLQELTEGVRSKVLEFIKQLNDAQSSLTEMLVERQGQLVELIQTRSEELLRQQKTVEEPLSTVSRLTEELWRRQEELKLLQQSQKDLHEVALRQSQVDNKELQHLLTQSRADITALAKSQGVMLPILQATRKQADNVEQLLKAQADMKLLQQAHKDIQQLVARQQEIEKAIHGNGSKDILLKSKDLLVKNNADVERIVKVQQSLLETVNAVQNQTERQASGVRHEVRMAYNRVDALLWIHKLVDTKVPLPVMDDWAISSDFGLLLIKTLLAQPGDVIDIGSGITTVLSAYTVKKLGKGKVVSLEHDPVYYEKTRQLIDEHGLGAYVNLCLCPLKEFTIKGAKWLWYDISKANLPKKPSMIIVDGPPGPTQQLARYPAIPLLRDRIQKNTAILLDDAQRPDEKQIGELWETEYKLKGEFVPTHKGTLILRKK